MRRPDKLLRLGVIGTLVVAVCCFTPVLAILLGTLGLAALTGYLDPVLLPTLAGFIALTLYALWRRQKAGAERSSEKRHD